MVFGKRKATDLVVHAIRIEQRSDAPLFVFGIDGRLIHQFAAIDAAHRNDAGVLSGYQRTRVDRHIREILTYLEQDDAMLPNAIVVAFDTSIEFVPCKGVLLTEWGTPGELHVSLSAPGTPKPALVVDGQQRISALAELPPDRPFPVVVVAFSTDSETLQREQFLLVNRTKPLPRDLLNELVPHVNTVLPTAWRVRRVAATVVEELRFTPDSPFFDRIRGIGSAGLGANISQAAVLAVIENSIRRKGVLSSYYSTEPGHSDADAMISIVSMFYSGVASVWPEAWDQSPRTSRLVHGVGIVALGRVMDLAMADIDQTNARAKKKVIGRLRPLRTRCAWTDGRWPRLKCEWNELQNTSQDKRRLAAYLVDEYGKRNGLDE